MIRQMENSGIKNDRPTGMTGTIFMVCNGMFCVKPILFSAFS